MALGIQLAAGPAIAVELNWLRRELDELSLPDSRVREIYAHLSRVPGKLLRPRLLFSLARRYDLTLTGELRRAALVIELLHIASLLQDDVFDRETSRRGQPSANVVFGDRHSLLAGDYLIVAAFRLADGIPDPAVRAILFETALRTCSGEISGAVLDHPRDLTVENYLRTVQGKTGAAFRAGGMIVRRYLADNADEAESLAGAFGELYQMLDDIRDGMQLLQQDGSYALKDVVSLPLILAAGEGRSCLEPLPSGKQLLLLIRQRHGYGLAADYLRNRYGWLDEDGDDDAFMVMLRALYQRTMEALPPACHSQL